MRDRVVALLKIVYTEIQYWLVGMTPEVEVRFNAEEVFGSRVHPGFEGNMFSREHLKEYLPRIAASAATVVQS